MDKNKSPEVELYERISANADMGADAIGTLLPKIRDSELQQTLRAQQSGYLDYAARATAELAKSGTPPATRGPVKKLPARLGIHMNTMLDDSASRIAEMVITGSDMGVIDMTRAMNRLGGDAPPAAERLGREVLEFEQKNIDRMKRYL